ncbi:hypothetical protein EVG20_g3117 [Dentipellis fragilis]|uniref:Uncharacterized protein n=1 Tax=Dentipellis fragilis TaxID=205917 RepID=A0A4Y9Z6R1_9AGAM|nr:hypothetical protein EVG20_g3117 [Dentipellis fragilis]
MACHELYTDQLATLNHGHALWEPDPNDPCQQVEVGDVGYVFYGGFHRLFNVHLAADHPSQGKPLPEQFEPLDCGPSHIYHRTLRPGPYRSRSVVAAEIDAPFVVPAGGQISLKFACSRRRGAVLVLPEKARRADTRSRGAYKEYMREHCERWHALTEQLKLSLRMEDLVLVTGCDRTTTWAVAAFTSTDFDSRIQLSVDFAGVGSASFASSLSWTHDENAQYNWGPDSETSVLTNELTGAVTDGGDISMSSSQGQLQKPINTKYNQCVFVRGLRAKSRGRFLPIKLKAAAEPIDLHGSVDGDSDGGGVAANPGEANAPEEADLVGEANVTGEPDPAGEVDTTHGSSGWTGRSHVVPDNYEHSDMIFPVLDYILQTSDVDLAIAHDEDLNPYTETATTASDIAQYLAENQPSVIKTVTEGVVYGSIECLSKEAMHRKAKRQDSSGMHVVVDTENVRYYSRSRSPSAMSSPLHLSRPESPQPIHETQSAQQPTIIIQAPPRSPPPSVSQAQTYSNYPSQIGTDATLVNPTLMPPYTGWGNVGGDTGEDLRSTELKVWTGLDYSDIPSDTDEDDEQPERSLVYSSTRPRLVRLTESFMKEHMSAFNGILFIGEGRRETQHHRLMMAYMKKVDGDGFSMERQLECLRFLTEAFASARPGTHLDVDDFEGFANKGSASRSELRVPAEYPSTLLKLALSTPYANPYHASGLLSDITKGIFPLLPGATTMCPVFDVSFGNLATVGLFIVPTHRLDEHLQLKGNVVKIFRLNPLMIPTLRTYQTNRIALAMGIEGLGREVLGSWRMLMEGISNNFYSYLSATMDLSPQQLGLISDQVRYVNAAPSRFAAREKRLQQFIRKRKRWDDVAFEDIQRLRIANPLVFYGTLLGVAFVAVALVQVQVFLHGILKIAAGATSSTAVAS